MSEVKKQLKIFFLSHCPPVPTWGGAMTFFRHFIERDDFETLVATSAKLDGFDLKYQVVRCDLPAFWSRALKTRLRPWLYGTQCLSGDWLLPSHVMKVASQFRPDAVFTVAGNWDWTTLAAQRVARRLDVPLIASFNDWFDYGAFPAHRFFRSAVQRRFLRLYRDADLALCTSDGMREALGDHPNAHVLYPTGAAMPSQSDGYAPVPVEPARPLTVMFGGSLGDWYGPMLEALVNECQQRLPHVQFRIFGALQTWSDDFDQRAKDQGIFRGRVSFDELREQAAQTDLLILPMGFGQECAQVERTSFKTKFLDYLSFRRPILVWGPSYCSAIRVAKEFDSAHCITESSAVACAEGIASLADDCVRRRALIANAAKMYYDRFHPDRIHQGLVQQISAVVDKHKVERERKP